MLARNNSFTFSVDFGTTNTYIAVRNQSDEVVPFSYSKENGFIATLNSQIDSKALRFLTQRTEFLPSSISNAENSPYTLPFRTVVHLSDPAESIPLLTTNIFFDYDKSYVRRIYTSNRKIKTNIKQ